MDGYKISARRGIWHGRIRPTSCKLAKQYPFLSSVHARRLTRYYGTLANLVLGKAAKEKDMGKHFGATLYENEVRYLVENEWAQSAEDILFRRTKQGLHMSKKEIAVLDKFVNSIT